MAEESGTSGTHETPTDQPAAQPAPEQTPTETPPQSPPQAPAAESAPQPDGPSLADVQSENEALRAILGAINPDMDINDELGYVGRGGKYRPPAAPAAESENRQSRRAPLQNARAEVDTDMTDEQIDKEFDQFMLGKYGFKYDDQPPA